MILAMEVQQTPQKSDSARQVYRVYFINRYRCRNAVLFATTFGTFPREYSPLTRRACC